jgi:hypothetical protein
MPTKQKYPVRKTDLEREAEDSLLTDEEKAAALSEVKRQASASTAFRPVDWDTIDPENPPLDMLERLRHLAGVKRWARKPLNVPLDLDEVRRYIKETWIKRQREAREAAETKAATLEKKSKRAETADELLQKKIEGYLALIVSPTPNDVASVTYLCTLEIRLEALQAQIDEMTATDEGTLRRRRLLTDEWKECAVQYREFQRDLGITKVKRDASNEGRSMADLYMADMRAAASWMEAEMTILVCPNPECRSEVSWIWWAYAHVHSPTPFYFAGRCQCGTLVTSGEKSLMKDVA